MKKAVQKIVVVGLVVLLSMSALLLLSGCSKSSTGSSSENSSPSTTDSDTTESSGEVPSDFVHPTIPKNHHTSTSFACSNCHPDGYETHTCATCHVSPDGGGARK